MSQYQERQFSKLSEDFVRGTAQQRRFSYYRSEGLKEAFGRPLVFEEVSEHLSRHQPLGTCSCRCLDSLADTNSLEHLFAQVSK